MRARTDLPLMRVVRLSLVAQSASHVFGDRDAAKADVRARDGGRDGCIDRAQDRDGTELAVPVNHGQRRADRTHPGGVAGIELRRYGCADVAGKQAKQQPTDRHPVVDPEPRIGMTARCGGAPRAY